MFWCILIYNDDERRCLCILFMMKMYEDVVYFDYNNDVLMKLCILIYDDDAWRMNEIISEIMKYNLVLLFCLLIIILPFRLFWYLTPLFLLVHCLYIDNVQIARSSLWRRLDEEYLVVYCLGRCRSDTCNTGGCACLCFIRSKLCITPTMMFCWIIPYVGICFWFKRCLGFYATVTNMKLML